MIFSTKRGITVILENINQDTNGLSELLFTFRKLTICRNIAYGVPQSEIELEVKAVGTDIKYFFHDGLEMVLIIQNEINNTMLYTNVVVFGTPVLESENPALESGNERTILKIQLLFQDTKTFLLKPAKNLYKGTLNNIIQTIAEETQNKTNKETSYRVQVSTVPKVEMDVFDLKELKIFSYGKTYIKLLRNILNYFDSDTDTLAFFYDIDNTLRVKNLNNLIKSTPTLCLKNCPLNLDVSQEELEKYSEKNNTYFIYSVKTKNFAGVLNNIARLNNILKKDSLFRDDIQETTKTKINRPLFSLSEMSKNQSESEIFYSSYCTDKNSKSSFDYYNNLKKKCLWSNEIDCRIDGTWASKIKILDLVKLEISNGYKRFYNGNYIVTGKTIIITGNEYQENLVLLSCGKNYGTLTNTI